MIGQEPDWCNILGIAGLSSKRFAIELVVKTMAIAGLPYR